LIADARKIREPRPASRKSPSQNREPRNVGRHRWRKNRELAAQKRVGAPAYRVNKRVFNT